METSPEQFVNPPLLFVKGDEVKLQDKFLPYSNSYKSLENKTFKVNECRVANLGDMLVEVIDLVEEPGVKNPYLAEHFIKIEKKDETN